MTTDTNSQPLPVATFIYGPNLAGDADYVVQCCDCAITTHPMTFDGRRAKGDPVAIRTQHDAVAWVFDWKAEDDPDAIADELPGFKFCDHLANVPEKVEPTPDEIPADVAEALNDLADAPAEDPDFASLLEPTDTIEPRGTHVVRAWNLVTGEGRPVSLHNSSQVADIAALELTERFDYAVDANVMSVEVDEADDNDRATIGTDRHSEVMATFWFEMGVAFNRRPVTLKPAAPAPEPTPVEDVTLYAWTLYTDERPEGIVRTGPMAKYVEDHRSGPIATGPAARLESLGIDTGRLAANAITIDRNGNRFTFIDDVTDEEATYTVEAAPTEDMYLFTVEGVPHMTTLADYARAIENAPEDVTVSYAYRVTGSEGPTLADEPVITFRRPGYPNGRKVIDTHTGASANYTARQ